MNPKISVVIPCCNSGNYLPEAIQSVQNYRGAHLYEIIIVDDGSTDEKTLNLLKEYSSDGISVIHQTNQGPASARNTGVKNASADYLLFLDSDNKILGDYIDKAVQILDDNAEVSVVYSNCIFFGEVGEEHRFRTRPFDLVSLIASNYIDMCSVVRRKMWDQIGGFDETEILIGHEDWEFWIRAGSRGFKFHYLDEPLFEYRLRHDSLITQVAKPEKLELMHDYVYQKHYKAVVACYKELLKRCDVLDGNLKSLSMMYGRDQGKPFRSFFKYLYKKHFV